jgi:amino acid transporter
MLSQKPQVGDVKILAELSSFSALLAFLAVNLALIVLRYQSLLKNLSGLVIGLPMKIARFGLA